MKNLSLLILILIFCQITVSSQPCLPGGITFTNQAQIDSFQVNHPNCTEIEGDVRITGNEITNLNGLSVLTSIGGDFWIRYNNALTSLTGLDNVTSIGGSLYIYNNDALTSLTGLEGLTSVGVGLDILYNYALTSLTGLDNVTSIGGALQIAYNHALTSLTGLEGLTSIGEPLKVIDNGALTSLTGLEGLTSIGGNLGISENESLTSLTGLDNVTSIGGYLWIGHNYALTSLTGLEGLTSIGEQLTIVFNGALTSLTGLDNVTSVGGLWISDNQWLSDCAILSICNYIANPNGIIIDIYDNATGCNSPEEVQDSCIANGVTISEKYILEGYSVSPNPFTSTTTLSYTLDKPSSVSIAIYNPQGQLIEKIEQEQSKGEQHVQWNAEGLPAGMYYFRIQAGNIVESGKMINME